MAAPSTASGATVQHGARAPQDAREDVAAEMVDAEPVRARTASGCASAARSLALGGYGAIHGASNAASDPEQMIARADQRRRRSVTSAETARPACAEPPAHALGAREDRGPTARTVTTGASGPDPRVEAACSRDRRAAASASSP